MFRSATPTAPFRGGPAYYMARTARPGLGVVFAGMTIFLRLLIIMVQSNAVAGVSQAPL